MIRGSSIVDLLKGDHMPVVWPNQEIGLIGLHGLVLRDRRAFGFGGGSGL